MQGLDAKTWGAAVRLIVFLVVTALCTGLLAVVIGNLSFDRTKTYRAMFDDVTGVVKGDDVRIAGVRVGSVKNIEVKAKNRAELTFSVRKDTPLSSSTDVAIRYRNLVGQRYLALSNGATGATGDTLKSDALIPRSHTKEALDLNVLFNGFKPLFQAMSPDQTNKLAYELIQVLQGEGGNVQNLLSRTASLTSTLADRDKLIGEVIDNLNKTLVTIGSRDKQLSATIVTLQRFATGLKGDRKAILGSIDGVTTLEASAADLLSEAREPLTGDIKQLRRAATGLNTTHSKKALADNLQILPEKMIKLGNAASTESVFNFYLCNLRGVVQIPKIPGLTKKQTELTIGQPGVGIDIPSFRCQS